MLKKLKRIDTSLKFSNPYWDYRIDNYELPNGGPGEYHYVSSRGATMVIPRTEDGKYVLIRQYRYLNQKVSTEFPGGGIREGSSPLENATLELREETGYFPGSIVLLGDYNPYNGVTNEICSIYLASDLKKAGSKPDKSEEFELLILSNDDIIDYIQQGEIWDGMTLAAWAIFRYSKFFDIPG